MEWSEVFVANQLLVLSSDYRFRILSDGRNSNDFQLEIRSGAGEPWTIASGYETLEAAKAAAGSL